MNIPNGLSLLRLLSAPLFCWLLLTRHLDAALGLFMLASVTDAADGYIAKRFGQETELGRYLDPLADKALLMVGFVTLSVIQLIPLWITLIVVTRDIFLIGGVVLAKMLTNGLQIRPLPISKLNTVFQIMLIIIVLLNSQFSVLNHLVSLQIWLTAISTVASFYAYISQWTRLNKLAQNGDKPLHS